MNYLRTSVKKNKKSRFITTLDRPGGLQRLQHEDVGEKNCTIEWPQSNNESAIYI